MLTVGVEGEYQLVNPETGDLQSRARAALEADWSDNVQLEVHQSTLEINTKICSSAAEVREELERLRLQTATAAAAEGLDLVAAGLHPTSHWRDQRLTEDSRYHRIAEEYGRIIRDKHIFGMHVHVAVPDDDCIRLLNTVRHFTPCLLALSCSSPFYEGADTGYDSYRAILWRRMPYSSVPPYFRSRQEYREHVDLLLRSGAIGDERNLYWSIRRTPSTRPSSSASPTSVPDRGRRRPRRFRPRTRRLRGGGRDRGRPVALDLDRPRARHPLRQRVEGREVGINAELVDPTTPKGTTLLREAIRRLLERVAPFAEQLGDANAIRGIESILQRGSAAERMRRAFRECGGFRPLSLGSPARPSSASVSTGAANSATRAPRGNALCTTFVSPLRAPLFREDGHGQDVSAIDGTAGLAPRCA